MRTENRNNLELPTDLDDAELVAEIIFFRLQLKNQRYEIGADYILKLLPVSKTDILNKNKIIELLHDYLIRVIKEKNVKNKYTEFRWERHNNASREAWRDLYFSFFSSKDNETIDDVSLLFCESDNFTKNSIWQEYSGIENAENILWADTMLLTNEFDNAANLAQSYLRLPFKSKIYESELLRCFYFLYANSCCFYFFNNEKTHGYYFSENSRLKDFRNYPRIKGCQVMTVETYRQSTNYLFFESLWTSFTRTISPFILILLSFWYFDFPNYSDSEFYVALVIGYYGGYRLNRFNEIARKKKTKKDDWIKRALMKFSKKVCKLMSFSVHGEAMLIDDLLENSEIIRFGGVTLEAPQPIREILIRAKRDGDLTVGLIE